MDISEITNQSEWNTFFDAAGSLSFHHSWEWGEFQKLLGHDILRIGLYEKGSLEAIALVVKIRAKRGPFLFIPHGPIFRIPSQRLAQKIPQDGLSRMQEQLKHIQQYLIDIAKQEGFWFIRIAPVLERTQTNENLFASLGFKTAPLYIHAETMWVVDLMQSADDILKNMRKNTRYYVKRAIRENMSVTKHASIEALDDFWNLYKLTSQREHFTPYSKTYLTHEFNAFHKNNNALFFFGGFHNSPKNIIPPKFAQRGASQKLAGSLIVFTKSCGYYHQGASIHTQFPAAYLLQWESILESQKRGCQYYSFHGIFDPGRTPRAWEGLSLFKRGFGGFQVDYLYTQDYVVSPWYFMNFCAEKYLAFRRGI